MTAVADLNTLVNRFSGGNSGTPEALQWHKESRVQGAAAAAPIAGSPISLWEYEGTPSHGAVPPATVAYPDNTTQGGWKHTTPGGGRQKWMSALGAFSSAPGLLVLYDRLAHISGLSGTVTTAQNVLASAITRNTGGVGNFMAVEVYTALGATGTTITASYTNDQGTAGQTSQAVAIGNTGRKEAQRLIELSLAAGDKGVQAISTVTVLATTGTAGNFGVIMGQKLAQLSIPVGGIGDIRSFLDGQFIELTQAKCLCWYFQPVLTTAPIFEMWEVAAEF